MRIYITAAAFAALYALNWRVAHSSPAPIPDGTQSAKELWVSTPEVTRPPAGVPTNFEHNADRRPQPPSGAHVPSAKGHPQPDEQTGRANFNGPMDSAAHRAPAYQPQPPTLKGVISALDTTKQSPLESSAGVVFKSRANSYLPNTQLFDTTALKVPLQTNRWWQNLILEQGVDPIHPYPYVVKCNKTSATVGFPKFLYNKANMVSDQAVDWEIADSAGALTKRQVTAIDALGVEVTWSGQKSSGMRSRFYKGMPFQTFELTSMAPVLKTNHAILKVEPLAHSVLSAHEHILQVTRDVANMPSLTKVTLNNGAQWLVATKPGIKWKAANGALVPDGSSGTQSYSGFVQLAHMGDNPDSNLSVLQQYAGTYAIEGSVTYAQVTNNSTGGRSSNIVLFYKTNTDAGGDTSKVYNSTSVSTTMQLLSFVLPHHVDHMEKTSLLSPGLSGYRSAKGPLTAVAGNMISYNQPLEPVSFEGRNKLSDSDRDRIQRQLSIDVATSLDTSAGDPYFFGKSVARVARLYQIASELGDSSSMGKLRDKLVSSLTLWLKDQSNSDPLVYDSSWGGIVSSKGIVDPGSDFGQGRYNDHHFHYGYFVYAGAILAQHDINSFAPLRDAMNQLLRDYASPSYADAYYPYMRHFDPYDGHSWAAGLFSFADGRNQESSGEAVNAYYAAYLYAKALGFSQVADFYETILNMEATSGRRYWHPLRSQAQELYGEPFIHNVIGINWASKADYVTFFGTNTEYIYGIQMLPFTPASELLIKRDWVKEAWCPDGSTCTDGMKVAAQQANNNGWAQLLYTAYSLVDSNAALDAVAVCKPDDGNTLTNSLYWILTSGQRSFRA